MNIKGDNSKYLENGKSEKKIVTVHLKGYSTDCLIKQTPTLCYHLGLSYNDFNDFVHVYHVTLTFHLMTS